MSPKDTLVYVGTYTGPKSKGIYYFRLQTSGMEVSQNITLVPLGLAAESVSPAFIEVDLKRRLLFAVNEVDTFEGKASGGVSAFAIDPANGKLTLINQKSVLAKLKRDLSVETTRALLEGSEDLALRISFTYTDRYKAHAAVKEVVKGMTERNHLEERAAAIDAQQLRMYEYRVGTSLEMLDPPFLPERAVFPNRLAITLGGLVLGLLLGIQFSRGTPPHGSEGAEPVHPTAHPPVPAGPKPTRFRNACAI